MKTLLAIFALTLPLMADRAITLAWDKHPEKVTIEIYQIVPGGKDKLLGAVPVNPESDAAQEMDVTIPDEQITVYAVALNGPLASDKSDLLVIPRKPSTPGKLRFIIQGTVSILPN